MHYETLQYELNGGIATLSLNRPDSFNAFNEQMGAEFLDALARIADSHEVKAVILAAKGKAFCSGQDLKEVYGKAHSLGEIVSKRYNPIIRAVTSIEKPFICRLHGIAAGAGASLALACDYVVASESASLLWAFVNIGLVLDSGSSWLLPRLVGMRKAFELATLGERIGAAQALELGLINRVVTGGELDEVVQEMAARYAAAPPIAIGLMKRMLNRSYPASLDQMLELERECQEFAGNTHDYQEGVAAFVEKRKPVFQGK